MDADLFHLHNARLLNPRDSGVVHPVHDRPVGDSDQDAHDREDVVRASGFTSYTFECDWEDFTLDDHTRLALLMEDVLDEIVQIKADAEARVLTCPPCGRSSRSGQAPESRTPRSLRAKVDTKRLRRRRSGHGTPPSPVG